MYKTIAVTLAKCSALVFFLFVPLLARASCPSYEPNICQIPPAPYTLGYAVTQNTSISLASQGPNPLTKVQGEVLGITVPRVSTTEVCEQPGYEVYYYDPDAESCFPYYYQGPYTYYGTGSSTAQPTGSAVIQQNGTTVGTVAIGSATSNYSFTTPPVNAIGNINFVAQFTGSCCGFTSATSNTLIVWSNGNFGFTLADYNAPALPATLPNGMVTYNGSVPQFMHVGDFNGDGKTDYAWIPQNGDGRWSIAYSTGTGFTVPDYNLPALPATLSNGMVTYNGSVPQFMHVGDFNGDGKTDYAWIPQNGDGRLLIAYSTGTGFTVPDYNAPALPATLPNGMVTYNGSIAQFMQFGDFNGDGKTDYAWIPQNGDGRWLIAYSTGTGFTVPDYNLPALPATLSNGMVTYNGSVPQFMHVGDFNGDGKTDYAWIPQNGDGRLLIAYSTGTGFTVPDYNAPALPATLPNGMVPYNGRTRHFMQLGDFNGDGKTDYAWIPQNGDGRLLIAYSTGTGFTVPDYNLPALPATLSNGMVTYNGR